MLVEATGVEAGLPAWWALPLRLPRGRSPLLLGRNELLANATESWRAASTAIARAAAHSTKTYTILLASSTVILAGRCEGIPEVSQNNNPLPTLCRRPHRRKKNGYHPRVVLHASRRGFA